jgi:hypothetical protein
MPTRKQRRRRAKGQRHEYEYVWEDAEGNELAPEDAPASDARSAKRAQEAPAGPRRPDPPSWKRTLRRAVIFAPIMLVTVMLLSSNLSTGQQITQTALIVGIFVPFSYLLDSLFYRSYKRRLERRAGGSAGGS